MQLPGAALYHTVSAQCGNGRSEEAAAIKAEAHTLHILAVQTRLVGNLQLIPAADLRPAGQARLYIVGTVLVALSQQVLLIPEGRARTRYNVSNFICNSDEGKKYPASLPAKRAPVR